MRTRTLADWLDWTQRQHRRAIALGLARVARVWTRLGPKGLSCPVLTVGGTNGKGSCVALAEAIYQAAGYRTGVYSSPHLLRYNERVRVDGVEVDDAALCEAFARVEAARGDTELTYFEFGTLAAFDLFTRAKLDLAILEVGLGGRLDAVNLLDADVALVTTIGRDHMAWLGEDPSDIAFEKAGIFRAGRPALIGQRQAPPALRARAEALGAPVFQLGREFDWRPGDDPGAWCWTGPDRTPLTLPHPALRGAAQLDNAAAVMMAVTRLADRLPVPLNAMRQGLHRVRLRGRFEVRPGRPTWILDVAHNGDAAEILAQNLKTLGRDSRLHAVLAVLADKEPDAIAGPLVPLVDHWHLGQTSDQRALPVAELAKALDRLADPAVISRYATIDAALDGATQAAGPDDRILVFGSFTTVEAALRRLGA